MAWNKNASLTIKHDFPSVIKIDMKVEPIHGERALYIQKAKAIVVADLHIGIEFEYENRGITIPLQTKSMMERIVTLIKRKRAKKLIILGDLKHVILDREHIMKERREVAYFLKELSKHAEIWIVKGNHDARLKSKYAKIFGARGILLDNIAMAHGHAWCSPSIMKASILIMAHLHPYIRITTKTGYSYTEPCWIKGRFKKQKFSKKYPDGNENMQVIVMPSFNPIAGGIAVNKEKLEHGIASLIDIENANVYLLNGINLGRVRNLR